MLLSGQGVGANIALTAIGATDMTSATVSAIGSGNGSDQRWRGRETRTNCKPTLTFAPRLSDHQDESR